MDSQQNLNPMNDSLPSLRFPSLSLQTTVPATASWKILTEDEVGVHYIGPWQREIHCDPDLYRYYESDSEEISISDEMMDPTGSKTPRIMASASQDNLPQIMSCCGMVSASTSQDDIHPLPPPPVDIHRLPPPPVDIHWKWWEKWASLQKKSKMIRN